MKSSARGQKKLILANPFWVEDGLQYCLEHGQWAGWERKLLRHLPKRARTCMWHAVVYATQVRSTAWPELEPLLLNHVLEFGVSLIPPERLELFHRYVDGIGTSPTLDAQVLHRSPTHAEFLNSILWYAATFKHGRWEEGEDHLLSSTEHMLQYAEEVLKGRLPEHLHQAMVLQSFADTADEHIKEYVRTFGL